MTTHAGLHRHLTAEHDLTQSTLAGADTARLVEMHQYEHEQFGGELDHTHERLDTDPTRLTPVALTVPPELVNDALDWVEDRAACEAAEDDPDADPWWADSDDAAADLVHRFASLFSQARTED